MTLHDRVMRRHCWLTAIEVLIWSTQLEISFRVFQSISAWHLHSGQQWTLAIKALKRVIVGLLLLVVSGMPLEHP